MLMKLSVHLPHFLHCDQTPDTIDKGRKISFGSRFTNPVHVGESTKAGALRVLPCVPSAREQKEMNAGSHLGAQIRIPVTATFKVGLPSCQSFLKHLENPPPMCFYGDPHPVKLKTDDLPSQPLTPNLWICRSNTVINSLKLQCCV